MGSGPHVNKHFPRWSGWIPASGKQRRSWARAPRLHCGEKTAKEEEINLLVPTVSYIISITSCAACLNEFNSEWQLFSLFLSIRRHIVFLKLFNQDSYCSSSNISILLFFKNTKCHIECIFNSRSFFVWRIIRSDRSQIWKTLWEMHLRFSLHTNVLRLCHAANVV